MLDGRGDLIWMDETFGPYVMNLKVQEYKGELYITFWSGDIGPGFGLGTYYMLDSHYQVFKQLSASNTMENDFHEFTITAKDTALLTSYDVVSTDLSSLDIQGPGWIYDSLFREIDIDTGEILFEWRASEHFAINDTFYPIGSAGQSPEEPFDFFHINSVDVDSEGNYIISSRFMHSIACISFDTGEILWTLGGRNNDFEDLSGGSATDFAWQHHVSVQSDNKLSIFDNAKYKKWHQELLAGNDEISRGMLVQLDVDNMTITLVEEYLNPGSRGSPQQGSMQVLDSGNVLLGWGYHAGFTEYAPTGKVLCDTHVNPAMLFSFGLAHSYRTFRANTWIGRPNTQPDVYLDPKQGFASVSWMGATEVSGWVLQVAKAVPGEQLRFVDAAKAIKDGFETEIEVPSGEYEYLRIVAIDKAGTVLASSKVISAAKGTVGNSSSWMLAGFGMIFWVMCFVMGVSYKKRLRLWVKRYQREAGYSSWLQRWRQGRKSSMVKRQEEERLYTS
ncbi:hypothetical protein E4T44_05577 [Aureobasidium sp. EXF-8845]|nr:hypothetical protein E4T44_05577 [Aureobasidium sp. EXF-8845]KAI4850425.1 hypothetical protein E4T45_05501 [Aureobasidium sp. EXF-8846]